MVEKKAKAKGGSGMRLDVPTHIAEAIAILAEDLGMQKLLVKRWVAEAAFEHVESVGILQIVRKRIDERLATPPISAELK